MESQARNPNQTDRVFERRYSASWGSGNSRGSSKQHQRHAPVASRIASRAGALLIVGLRDKCRQRVDIFQQRSESISFANACAGSKQRDCRWSKNCGISKPTRNKPRSRLAHKRLSALCRRHGRWRFFSSCLALADRFIRSSGKREVRKERLRSRVRQRVARRNLPKAPNQMHGLPPPEISAARRDSRRGSPARASHDWDLRDPCG